MSIFGNHFWLRGIVHYTDVNSSDDVASTKSVTEEKDMSSLSLSLRASVNSFFHAAKILHKPHASFTPFAPPSFARFAHYTESIDLVPAYRLTIDRAVAVYSVCRQWTIRMSTTS